MLFGSNSAIPFQAKIGKASTCRTEKRKAKRRGRGIATIAVLTDNGYRSEANSDGSLQFFKNIHALTMCPRTKCHLRFSLGDATLGKCVPWTKGGGGRGYKNEGLVVRVWS